jgi:hypothetical protein
MKKQSINAKLSLGKDVLSQLTNEQAARLMGGYKTHSNNGSCYIGSGCSGTVPVSSGNTCLNTCDSSCAC